MLKKPEKGFLKRMRIYLREMYPPLARLVPAALLYFSFIALLGRIQDARLDFISPFTLLGIWNIFALLLILRLMDELKDREIDLMLFKERPLPSGKVLDSDISFSLLVMVILYLAANTWTGKAFWMALIVIGYSLLMFKYFFIPRILRKYLLLNLATHNPVLPLMLFQMVVLFSVQHGLSVKNLKWISVLLLIAMFWAMFFAWEISRKIRSKEEENEYVTYSQIFGRIGAVLIAAGAQTVTFIIALYFSLIFSFSRVFIAILVAGYALTVAGYARFIIKPNPSTSKLKPFGEKYILSVFIAGIINHFLIG